MFNKNMVDKFNRKVNIKIDLPGKSDGNDDGKGNKALPLGMGYKSCWMVVEGASKEAITEVFLQGDISEYAYKEGMEKVAKAGMRENLLFVTADYENQNYAMSFSLAHIQWLRLLKPLYMEFLKTLKLLHIYHPLLKMLKFISVPFI